MLLSSQGLKLKLFILAATMSSGHSLLSTVAQRRLRLSFVRSAESPAEPDLFDYFDPLLSPHAYPNGISPDHKPVDPKEIEERNMEASADEPSLEDISKVFAASSSSASSSSSSFRSFLNTEEATTAATAASDEPIPLSDVKFDNMSKSSMQKGAVIDPDYFDPTLSPHAYPNGTPDKWIGDAAPQEPPKEKKKEKLTGILLMDHGSRNQASNDRLHELAEIYQQSVGGPIVVKAAHMEIAEPSIPDGLQALLDAGVDEIVCHPFFLSANGRHVSEDIPEIVEGAIESLKIEIPITTTEPVGSQTDVMIRAIHTAVLEKSRVNP